jgi:2Fe-2S iron-sulfur cluster binding domain
MPTITIEQLGLPVESRKGTILDAALAAGVPFPHSCRVGECGACKSPAGVRGSLLTGARRRGRAQSIGTRCRRDTSMPQLAKDGRDGGLAGRG